MEITNITVGVVGLGLIGGSIAKAYKGHDGIRVYGYDADDSILAIAKIAKAIDAPLNDNALALCDCVIIAVNPGAAVEYLKDVAGAIPKNAIVFDCCGVKRTVCEQCFAIAEEQGFTFVGAHPMAGSHRSGFKHSRGDLFKGAVMALVPPVYDDMEVFGRIERLLKPIGFGKLTVTTAEKHDEIVAFTSQLAHVVSNAYVKSPAATAHKGLSAGSYKDLTRVARLNADMWAELFLANGDALAGELDILIDSLKSYRDAINDGDFTKLRGMLEEGSRLKKEIDG
jgi:prephenate dehydrogenase